MKNYTCVITSNNSLGRVYSNVGTSSARKCADLYGRCDDGEKVRVYRGQSDRAISGVDYNASAGGYIRVTVGPAT